MDCGLSAPTCQCQPRSGALGSVDLVRQPPHMVCPPCGKGDPRGHGVPVSALGKLKDGWA